MKFAIITHAAHKVKDKNIFAYTPYVKEMNLWLKYVDKVQIVAPISNEDITSIESRYVFFKRHSQLDWESHDLEMSDEMLKQVQHDEKVSHSELVEESQEMECISKSLRQAQTDNKKRNVALKRSKLTSIQAFDLTSLKNGVQAVFKIPKICWKIYKTMKWADHIHLRCPGNIGLLGSFVQLVFPNKPKTIKYAGNWDPNSKQPWSYRLQKWILSNTFLTRNAKVLIYGKWPKQSKNCISFFTASYSEEEFNSDKIQHHPELDSGSHDIEQNLQMLNQVQHDGKEVNLINILFVGALTKGKQPVLSVQVVHKLLKKGYPVKLHIYGEGSERTAIEQYIKENKLQASIRLLGNVSQDELKKAYQNAQFLLFISKSEGWPKVIAEAMFWGCLPISSRVSCIPYMLDNGNRGVLVSTNETEISTAIEDYINDSKKYHSHVENAIKWSREFTLEKFEEEIEKVLTSFEV